MKKLARIAVIAASMAAIPSIVRADPPLPPGCTYVMGVLICLDEPIGP